MDLILNGIIASVAAAVLALVFDAFVFGVTVYKTYGHAMEMRARGERGLTGVLLRDGQWRMRYLLLQLFLPVSQAPCIFCK